MSVPSAFPATANTCRISSGSPEYIGRPVFTGLIGALIWVSAFKRRAVAGTTDSRRNPSAELQLLLFVRRVAAELNASQPIVELILVRLQDRAGQLPQYGSVARISPVQKILPWRGGWPDGKRSNYPKPYWPQGMG